MRKYNIIVLLDHTEHSAENSVYPIVSQMAHSDRVESIQVVSRGNPKNNAFFNTLSSKKVLAKSIDGQFEFDPSGNQFIQGTHEVDVLNFDIIFLRLPHPITDDFLIKLGNETPKAIIFNDPFGIVKCGDKSVLLNFQKYCPPIKLCHSINEIIEFSQQMDLILKPLKSYGGKGILKISGESLDDGDNTWNTREYLNEMKEYIETEGFLAMKFLKNVDQGDKRLLVVDGEIMAASLRMPGKDSWLCNVSRGGYSVPATPDKNEIEIVKNINSFLKVQGIFIYGLDTLTDDDGKRVISEINVHSIGGFAQAQEQTGRPIIQFTIDKILANADAHYN